MLKTLTIVDVPKTGTPLRNTVDVFPAYSSPATTSSIFIEKINEPRVETSDVHKQRSPAPNGTPNSPLADSPIGSSSRTSQALVGSVRMPVHDSAFITEEDVTSSFVRLDSDQDETQVRLAKPCDGLDDVFSPLKSQAVSSIGSEG